MSAGLLLARAYAVIDQKRLVLAILGILGVCAIVSILVCTRVHFCDRDLWHRHVAGRYSFGQLWQHPYAISHIRNVSSTYCHACVKYTQWSIRGKHVKVIFIITSLTVSLVGDISSILVILFDTIVVIVTLAGTLGTWRVYKRSTWNMLTLTHLLAEQSM